MPTIMQLPISTIKYVGLIDERKLLTTIRAWLIDEGFEFKEPAYKNKVSPEGLEIEIKIEGEKKVTSYVKFFITLQMWIREIKEVPVVKDGVQQLAKEGKVWIESSGYLELDWQDRFGGSRFLQALQDIYHKIILKKTIEVKWWDALYYKIYKLNSVIRNALGFETA